LYAGRMQIEHCFRDWKSHLRLRGLHLEVERTQRLLRLLMAFTLAYLLTLPLGQDLLAASGGPGGRPAGGFQAVRLADRAKLHLRIRIAYNTARARNGQSLDDTPTTSVAPTHERRLPIPTSLLIKDFKGQVSVVKVLDNGFEFEGKRYKSLSAIAQEITGAKWNGLLFFGLTEKKNGRR